MSNRDEEKRSEEERIEDVREEAAPPHAEPAQQEAQPQTETGGQAHPGLREGNRVGEGADQPDETQQHGAGGALPGTTTDTSPEAQDAREQLTQDEQAREEG